MHVMGGASALARRLAVMLSLMVLGVAAATLLAPDRLVTSPPFFLLASALLAVGLFSSTFSIPRMRREDLRVVLLAVTVGVLAKAAIITAVMALFFRQPQYLVLGAVMAQIDPLSVAALQSSSQLSERGRGVLLAWSSFDDPITSVLVILFAAVIARMAPALHPGSYVDALLSPGSSLVGNILLFIVASAVWLVLVVACRQRSSPDGESRGFTISATIILVGFAVVAVVKFLMLGLAAAGLFFRPRIGALLERATGVAFAVATLMLGIVMANGVSLLTGLVLGVTAFAAQAATALVVTSTLLRPDRARLALSQQSGITAIILALLLEPVFHGTVAVVAPAIMVVNLLHITTNSILDRRSESSENDNASSIVTAQHVCTSRAPNRLGRQLIVGQPSCGPGLPDSPRHRWHD